MATRKLKPGTWTVPVRWDLHRDPRVEDLADELNLPSACAAGLLVVLWGYVSYHHDDLSTPYQWGRKADRVSVAQRIDRLVGVNGFAIAAESVGWLQLSADGAVVLPGVARYMQSRSEFELAVESKRERDRDRQREQRRKSGQSELSTSRQQSVDSGSPDGFVASDVTCDVTALSSPSPSPSLTKKEGRPKPRVSKSPERALKAELAELLPELGIYWTRNQVALPESLLSDPPILIWVEKFLTKQATPPKACALQGWLEETVRLSVVQKKRMRAYHAWKCAANDGWTKPGWNHRTTEDAIKAEPEPSLLDFEQKKVDALRPAGDRYIAAHQRLKVAHAG